MVNQTMLHSLLVVVLLSTTIYAIKSSNGLILEMIHSDSPKSPLYRSNLTNNERMKMYIKMSTARVISIRRSRVPSVSPNEGLIRPKLSIQDFAYIIQVGIGTFMNEIPTSKTYYLQLDTGSPNSWVQCEGCIHCLNEVDPPFPASQSSTYVPFLCSECPPGTTCKDNHCELNIEYVDGSKVLAISAREVFIFPSQGESSHSIKNIVFGCGFDIPYFEGGIMRNKLSGIMGMSNGLYGFMEQTKMIFNGMFSYCLQSVYRPGGPQMYLRFGNDVLPHPIEMQTTPIYKHGDDGEYYLNLQGISVGTQRLPIDPNIFAYKTDGTGGCIIDSGTTISWIVTGAFTIFKDAVISYIKEHNKDNWRKMRKHDTEYKLCYQRYKLPRTILLPAITFHFENNADYEMQAEESFYQGYTSKGKNMVCLDFLESTVENQEGITYLGGIQQANKRIVYDLQNSLLHFGAADCYNQN